ncbi:olfactory receptor 1M1-like [Rhinophrynus dorsalis]
MENQTSVTEFYILTLTSNAQIKHFLFFLLFCIYLIGITVNVVIITVICVDSQLHTPLYLFLSNLSVVDICYTTVTVPKLMDILISGHTSISFIQCFIQMSFFYLAGSAEDILLYVMAYDRYVAICKPLHYALILSKTNCIIYIIGIWICAGLNSICITIIASHIPVCHSNTIQQFYCDVKALSKISCADTGFYILIYAETFFFGLCPFVSSLMSYIKIITVILRIKSTDGRRKAFSTCSSHLTVLIIFYGTSLSVYMRPSSQQSDVPDKVFSVLYTAVTPMLNPLIYSLRNKDIKNALVRMTRVRPR